MTVDSEKLKEKVEERRTFAIISHPDAGKTTITEQMLKLGGAIRETGTVKGRKTGKFATSDWMEVEQKRGISVTSSVMHFNYDDKHVNILDTPGHEDFSEDTYRTLMAVDSSVMVVDSANGIESQTEKLFKVCRMRGIPIFTFMNKLDRDGRDPLDLVEELEEVLEIDAYAMNWPIGSGQSLIGSYDIYNNRIEFANPDEWNNGDLYLDLNDEGEIEGEHPLKEDALYQQILEEVELLKVAGNSFSREAIANGELTPVFFGSALTGFGVESFLNSFLNFAPAPSTTIAEDEEEVSPVKEEFTGFIFKIQANMDPRHRDRIAFLRICSGQFEPGLEVTLSRTDRPYRLSNSTQFMAEDRAIVKQAVAGDIIGLYDTGNYQIGDTLYEGKEEVTFKDLPQFTPEIFMQVEPKNVMKQKSYHKGIKQLVQEGAIQLYRTYYTGDYILGAVGQLQFEVFENRMNNEYNSEVIMKPLGDRIARWIDPEDLEEEMSTSRSLLAKDGDDQPVILFESDFALRWFSNKYPEVELKSLL
ncbi:MAG: peptide chain release factor 3 [Atopostipes sp.]|nr:peptide chain release factor 3 [Atopostipes sp.]